MLNKFKYFKQIEQNFRQKSCEEAKKNFASRINLIDFLKYLKEELNNIDFSFNKVNFLPINLPLNSLTIGLSKKFKQSNLKKYQTGNQKDWTQNPRYKTTQFLQILIEYLEKEDTTLTLVEPLIKQHEGEDDLDYYSLLEQFDFFHALKEAQFLEQIPQKTIFEIHKKLIRNKILTWFKS